MRPTHPAPRSHLRPRRRIPAGQQLVKAREAATLPKVVPPSPQSPRSSGGRGCHAGIIERRREGQRLVQRMQERGW